MWVKFAPVNQNISPAGKRSADSRVIPPSWQSKAVINPP